MLPPASAQPGDLLAQRFVIERQAGRGGMGFVYRALDRARREPVALKLLAGEGDRQEERFAAECRILAGLSHAGIVRFVAQGVTDAGQRWLAMEWLEGEDLAARIARAGLGVDDSVALALAAAEALAAAHARGVIHRDIKPSNIFLVGGDPRRIKLIDFGIARLSGATSLHTRTGVVMGTPGYLAPEQARGERADARADVFALGAVLFECLTGRPAFAGTDVLAVLARLLIEPAPRVRELRPDVPPALDALVARLLAKDPAARPASAAEVAAALRALGAQGGEPAPVPGAALTAGEQRVLSLVMAAPADAACAAGGETLPSEVPAGAAGAAGETLPSEVPAARRRRLEAAISRLGGRVDQLAGGGVLVSLHSKGSATDQAARAARCAMVLGPLLDDSGGAARIAVVTGRAELTGQTPVGDLIDRAATMLASARRAAGVAMLDEVTRALLDPRFEVRRGPAGFELHGEREAGGGARMLLGRKSPCVGRDREIRALVDLFEECAGEGLARAALVTGPPGIGKSRLCDEALQRIRALRPDVEIWTGRADVVGEGAPFGVLGEAIRCASGALAGAPLGERQARIRARVARRVPEAEQRRVAEMLGEIAGAPFPDEESPALRAARQHPAAMAEQIGRAFEDFVAAEVEARPILLALDDLHWGDLPSVRLLGEALRRLEDRPLFVLALGRPEVHERFPGLWAERSVQEIRLAPLPRRAAERLAVHALGDAVGATRIAELVERAAGNPFYLEELLRAVSEGRGEALPETVLAMVHARISALDPAERRVLRAASVFGEVFWAGGARRLLGGDLAPQAQGGPPPGRDDVTLPATGAAAWVGETLRLPCGEPASSVSGALASLVAREVIERRAESRFPGEEELAFRHALLREGAYATLTDADRALGHKLAAAWLTAAGESDPGVLAEHLERGGERAQAAARYLEAAALLLRGGDTAGAIERAERGVQCGAEGELHGALRLVQCEALSWVREKHRAGALAEQVQRLARPGSRNWCLATAEMLWSALEECGSAERIELVSGDLLATDPDPEAAAAFAEALYFAWSRLMFVERRELAEAYGARLDRLDESLGRRDLLVSGHRRLMQAEEARLVRGDGWAALQLVRQAEAAFDAAGMWLPVEYARVGIAQAYVELGVHDRAEEILRTLLPEGSSRADVSGRMARWWRAVLRCARGMLDEAITDIADLASALAAQQDRFFEGLTRVLHASLLCLRGDLAAAEREALAAIEGSVMPSLADDWARTVLAQVRLAQGRAAEAAAITEDLVARLQAIGLRPPEATELTLVHAEALHATGATDEARAALAAARADLLARADRIPDAEIRRCFLENVPENARLLALAEAWLG
ncbi:serine/threonine-protein kinase [Sorangium sp. So ce363]|uniref:serine/threonine-protein kinase n=1 Tax=Sorangium sp. So ce363 TaxID=3133304 RepID=UPI003F5DC13E